jgi:hypothetical protein
MPQGSGCKSLIKTSKSLKVTEGYFQVFAKGTRKPKYYKRGIDPIG